MLVQCWTNAVGVSQPWGLWGPVVVVVDAEVFEEDLCLEEGVEELAVEELVAQAAVEGLDVAVLPGRSGVDEHGAGVVEAAPVSHGVRDELGSVIAADERRGPPAGGNPVEDPDDVIRVDGAGNLDGQGLAGVLVDDVQQLERAATG